MNSPYADDLDQVVWSYSTVSMYEECPYAFYLKKIENEDRDGNFYAENGSVIHQIFSELESGDLALQDAPQRYSDDFSNIEHRVAQSTMDKTFDSCLDYLCECEDYAADKYEKVWIEQEVRFDVGKYHFIGFVDLLLRNRETGELVLVDHKSCEPFFGKNGQPLKKGVAQMAEYSRQMYLYCKAIYEVFGDFPAKIVWHHFRFGGRLSVINFDMADYENTLKWAEETVSAIYNDIVFEPHQSYMMCYQLCDYRKICEYKNNE